MTARKVPSAIVLGTQGKLRHADDVWQVVQYLSGFQRLGIEPFYVETAAGLDGYKSGSDSNDSETIERIMRRFGFADHWGILNRSADQTGLRRDSGPCSERLDELFNVADLVVRLDTDAPIPLDSLSSLMTRGVLAERPAMPPIIMDLWHPHRGRTARAFAVHLDFASLVDTTDGLGSFTALPSQTAQALELVVGSDASPDWFNDRMADRLRTAGWKIRDAGPMSRDADWYRQHLVSSRGEIVLPHAAVNNSIFQHFPGRSAAYLAAGRPVLMHSSFSADLASTAGLLRFTTLADLAAAVEKIAGDYEQQCNAAAEMARSFFSSDVILQNLLDGRKSGVTQQAMPSHAPAELPRQARISADFGVQADKVNVTSFNNSGSPRGSRTGLLEPIIKDGKESLVLLVSCVGDEDTGGGLFAIDTGGVEEIDRISTLGMHLFSGPLGEPKLLRSVRSADIGVAELLVYDSIGIRHYHRVDGISDVHDVHWDGSRYVVVSTGTNSIAWIAPTGEITRLWQPKAQPKDSWHLNSLIEVDGRLLVSAFGRFPTHRGWYARKGEPDGILFDLRSGRDVLTGLSCPHNPRRYGSDWLICNSANFELLQLDGKQQTVKRRLRFHGWTRGLAISDRYLFVGESAKRRDPESRTASVAVVCRETWKVVHRVTLPCREIYDLVVIPQSLLRGVRTGFGTNPMRKIEQDQHAMFRAAGVRPLRLWATGEPLALGACQARISASGPKDMAVNEELTIDCLIQNAGGAFLMSAPPNPIFASYRWLDGRTRQQIPMPDGARTMLPRILPPGESMDLPVRVTAPSLPGEYVLRLTLVQENVAWFDQIDIRNSRDFCVHIRTLASAPSAESGSVKTEVTEISLTTRSSGPCVI